MRPTSDTYIESGVYEVNQGLYSDANFALDGSLIRHKTAASTFRSKPPGCYDWAGRAPGHYKIGFGYVTSSTYKDFTNALAAAGVRGTRRADAYGNFQGWALADQMLVRNGPGDDRGLIALAGIIENDPNNTQYGQQYFAAFLDRGFGTRGRRMAPVSYSPMSP